MSGVIWNGADYVDKQGRLMTVIETMTVRDLVTELVAERCRVQDASRYVVAVCGKCGAPYTVEAVAALEPLKGGKTMPSADDGIDLVLYNCPPPCSSTFSVRVKVQP